MRNLKAQGNALGIMRQSVQKPQRGEIARIVKARLRPVGASQDDRSISQGVALIVLHIFSPMTRAECGPGNGEVTHTLQADPGRLRTRRTIVFAIEVAAQLRDHFHHLV